MKTLVSFLENESQWVPSDSQKKQIKEFSSLDVSKLIAYSDPEGTQTSFYDEASKSEYIFSFNPMSAKWDCYSVDVGRNIEKAAYIKEMSDENDDEGLAPFEKVGNVRQEFDRTIQTLRRQKLV